MLSNKQSDDLNPHVISPLLYAADAIFEQLKREAYWINSNLGQEIMGNLVSRTIELKPIIKKVAELEHRLINAQEIVSRLRVTNKVTGEHGPAAMAERVQLANDYLVDWVSIAYCEICGVGLILCGGNTDFQMDRDKSRQWCLGLLPTKESSKFLLLAA